MSPSSTNWEEIGVEPFNSGHDDPNFNEDADRIGDLLREWFVDWTPPKILSSEDDVEQTLIDAAADIVATMVRVRRTRERAQRVTYDQRFRAETISVINDVLSSDSGGLWRAREFRDKLVRNEDPEALFQALFAT